MFSNEYSFIWKLDSVVLSPVTETNIKNDDEKKFRSHRMGSS